MDYSVIIILIYIGCGVLMIAAIYGIWRLCGRNPNSIRYRVR